MSELARSPLCRRRALVVAQHHPAHALPIGPHNWIDGIQGSRALEAAYGPYPHLAVLHGHVHSRTEKRIGAHEARSFSASAVVDSDDPLRLYDVEDGRLRPVETADDVTLPASEQETAYRSLAAIG